MRTYHRVMDVNKDGTVSWDDFKDMARKFAEIGHLDEVQQQEFVQQLKVRYILQLDERAGAKLTISVFL